MSISRTYYAGPVVLCLGDQDDVADIAEEIREALHVQVGEDGPLWLPNIRRDPPREFTIDVGSEVQVCPELLAEEITWMTAAYAAEIEVLRKYYEHVDVQWRVLGWAD